MSAGITAGKHLLSNKWSNGSLYTSWWGSIAAVYCPEWTKGHIEASEQWRAPLNVWRTTIVISGVERLGSGSKWSCPFYKLAIFHVTVGENNPLNHSG
jgi:hypothetical protein